MKRLSYLLLLCGVGALAGYVGYWSGQPTDLLDYGSNVIPSLEVDEVLDGDTVVVNGEVMKIRGMDAPEIDVNASCAAEAGFGIAAQGYLEGTLTTYDPHWKVTNVERLGDATYADIVDTSGGSIAEIMTFDGWAVATDERWDWCRESEDFDPRNEPMTSRVGTADPEKVSLADD